MRWLAMVMLVVFVSACASSGGTVQGGGSDRSSQGRVGWRLPL
jgi:hypothetical protein